MSLSADVWFCRCCVNQSFCLGEFSLDPSELVASVERKTRSNGLGLGAGVGGGLRMFSEKSVCMIETGTKDDVRACLIKCCLLGFSWTIIRDTSLFFFNERSAL